MRLRDVRDLIIDTFSWANYRQDMADPRRPGGMLSQTAPTWVPDGDLRRLAAYKIAAAYDHNQAGQLHAVTRGEESALDRRELGDAAKLIDTALGYLLGDGQTITVPGAERVDAPAVDDSEPPEEVKTAALLQEDLRAWAEKELLPMRMQQAERVAVRGGDTVYTLAWDPARARPRLSVYDPGFYFPDFDDDADQADYPDRVHFAWQIPADPNRGTEERVRRITYELGPIGVHTRTAADGGRREPVVDGNGWALLTPGDAVDSEGRITREYPWQPDRPATVTCYLTDAEWRLKDLKGHHTVYNLPTDKATYRRRADGEVLERLDLMVDYLPVVHVPNTIPDAGEHWGRPVFAGVLQALDELSATDTDSAASSATTGAPVVAVSGARMPVNRTTGQPEPVMLRAGSVVQLADGGSMDVLDTAGQLAELRQRTDHLLDRIAVNSRLTSAGLGTLDPTALPSGYALELALGPLDSLIGEMRLVRDHKYTLLLKFVARLYQAGRVWPAGELPSARLAFGPLTPTDQAAVLDLVVKAYEAGVISLETAVRMLMDAGFPIDSAATEIDLIQARDFDAAARLADATGDSTAVREYLGLPEADPETGPAPLISTPDLPDPERMT
ncbi:hypothetical protein [Streptomyces scabiei]|uniref:hypothetical protein n=1 Tax=Streptomyces scabiei TaxID=1930 RepID=UPI0029BBD576|nr:hypothetical protein [Streptomyces scabiei]MDX3205149.1 hypothetical protein [Streptomyces scabiei]